MRVALQEAQKAFALQEVPVGAVIVQNNTIIASAHNLRETKQSATAHAELLAIEKSCEILGSWRLLNCTLYVTLEPCPMCAGAIINSRIDRIVFGTFDSKAGSCGSKVDLFDLKYNHIPQVSVGVLQEECGEILSRFFSDMRERLAMKRRDSYDK